MWLLSDTRALFKTAQQMPAVPRSHVTSQISKLEGLSLIYISANFQKLKLVEKERCQEQCDLGLLAWALMGFPALGCIAEMHACGLWLLFRWFTCQLFHTWLRECPDFLQPVEDKTFQAKSFRSSLSLSWCQP